MNRLIATYKGHYKALFYLGLPIVIGQMGVIVLGFADTLMVGHHSTAELAAASFTNNLFRMVPPTIQMPSSRLSADSACWAGPPCSSLLGRNISFS